MSIAPRRVIDPLLYVLAGKRANTKSKGRAIAPGKIMRPSVVRALAVVAVLALLAAGAPFAYWVLNNWSKRTDTVSQRNPNAIENNSISLASPLANEAIQSLANERIVPDEAVSQSGLNVSDGLASMSESQLRAIQFSAAEYSIEQSVVEPSVIPDGTQAAQTISINPGDYYRLAVLTRLVWFDQFYRKREVQLPEGAHIHYLKSFVGDDGQYWASVEIHPQWDVSQVTIFGSILESDLTSQALIEVEPLPTASSN